MLVVVAAAAVLAVACADDDSDERAGRTAAARQQPEPEPLPEPDAALPRDPARLADTFTDTTRRLRDALGQWDGAGTVPRDVTYLALHHQRIPAPHGAADAPSATATLKQSPQTSVKGEARDTVLARRGTSPLIPRSPVTSRRSKVAEAAPADELRTHYQAAQKRYGINWSTLAVDQLRRVRVRARTQRERGGCERADAVPAFHLGPPTARKATSTTGDSIMAAALVPEKRRNMGNGDRALFAYNHSNVLRQGRETPGEPDAQKTSAFSGRTTRGRSMCAPPMASSASPDPGTTSGERSLRRHRPRLFAGRAGRIRGSAR